jgi:hypothetical protein
MTEARTLSEITISNSLYCRRVYATLGQRFVRHSTQSICQLRITYCLKGSDTSWLQFDIGLTHLVSPVIVRLCTARALRRSGREMDSVLSYFVRISVRLTGPPLSQGKPQAANEWRRYEPAQGHCSDQRWATTCDRRKRTRGDSTAEAKIMV